MGEPAPEGMTLTAFLDWDDGTDRRYELIAGRPVAMAPPMEVHGTIVSNISGSLLARLPNRYRAVSDAGVVLGDRDDTFYVTDIAVSCSPIEPGSRWATEPVVLIEVLSPSTRKHDRAVKLPDYRQVPSVQEIVLVSSESRRVEHWHREADGWRVTDLIGDAEIRLDSIDVIVPFDAVYRSLGF